MTNHKRFWKRERAAYRVLIVICAAVLVVAIIGVYFADKSDEEYVAVSEEDPNRIENGIHLRTGLVEAEGLMETVTNCTSCHSAKLLTQNRLSKEGWVSAIRWMQETQNLWDLGDNEEIIVNYLAKNYPPESKGRRENIKKINWYELQ
ncbi:monoheme cytochrome C [Muriicola sp. Z0-33]|uniref:monoheme cytochrome C n=1 Tax=Muriicola sp. Z0-33 TaxID=2816957 RepID=UPI0022381505|nr:monoheme cytochrome C [Muriicola sp. Z0-33]MCW5516289.1 monoheme cytochrome C [Muriicola sp. Z0-33]